MAYIAGIEASKNVVNELHKDTCAEIDHLEWRLEREHDEMDAMHIQDRLDICYHDERVYASILTVLDGMIETEISDMATEMEERYSA